MMTTKYPARLIVQSDWDVALKSRDKRIWCHYKQKDHVDYMHLSLEQRRGDGETTKITKIEKQQLHIEHRNSHLVFQSPHTTYRDLHQQKKRVNSLAVTAGGLGVSSGADEKMLIWETATGEVRRSLQGHLAEVYRCLFFPSNIVVLSGGADMQIKVWAAEDGRCAATMRGHHAAIHDLCVVERGRNIVSCSKDGTARLWDVGRSDCLRVLTPPESSAPLNACLLDVDASVPDSTSESPDDREIGTEGKRLVVTAESGMVFVFDLRQGGAPVSSWRTGDAPVGPASLTPSAHQLCVGTDAGAIVRLDLRRADRPLDRLMETRSGVHCLYLRENFLYGGFGDGTVARYDLSTGNDVWSSEEIITPFELTGPDCEPIACMSSSGEWLFTGCRDGVVRKYRIYE